MKTAGIQLIAFRLLADGIYHAALKRCGVSGCAKELSDRINC